MKIENYFSSDMTEAEKSDKITVKRGMKKNGFDDLIFIFYFILFYLWILE